MSNPWEAPTFLCGVSEEGYVGPSEGLAKAMRPKKAREKSFLRGPFSLLLEEVRNVSAMAPPEPCKQSLYLKIVLEAFWNSVKNAVGSFGAAETRLDSVGYFVAPRMVIFPWIQ
jgi:hypothetical protein